MAKTSSHEVIPSAKRLILSLRDMGYDFSTAVADLVDNSIEAGATLVKINVEFDGDDSWVRLVDNGSGMTLSNLKEAMRYGSEREYDDEKDLGKFGLGLKTASMSQCQRLTVATRSDPKRREINAFCWDLDHVTKTNRWEIVQPDQKNLKLVLDENLLTGTGTVVFWQRLDRILGYKLPYGENAKKRLSGMCREVEEHLAMVFHRFLLGEVRGKKLQIVLNDNPVKAWDPFARKEEKTKRLEATSIRFEHEGVTGEVILEPYVLPHQDDFSSKDAFTHASGPRKWNRQQGFYIYRANRLIQSGGWSGLKTIDEHLKLARVALSFSPRVDDAFKINVAKMQVQLPPQIRDQIEAGIKDVTRIAQETYRKKNKSLTGPPIPSPNPIPSANLRIEELAALYKGKTSNSINSPNDASGLKRLWTLDELQKELESSALPNEKIILDRVFARLRKNL
jgi:anti-sigma regulatory factor (Ser/Thr protein kinase)